MDDASGIVKLVSREGGVYEVPIDVARMSNFVASMMDDAAADKDENGNEIQEIPIPDVGNAVMSKVIEFCMYYKEQTPMIPIEKPLKSSNIEDLVQPSWYVDFMKVEQVLLFELVRASHSMDIPPLLELSCVVVSILIKDIPSNELRALFGIGNE